MDTNRSAIEFRLAAFQRLNQAQLVDENADDSANRDQQRRLRGILNRTFQFYYHQNRVNDSAVLHADQQVAAATAWRAPNVTALLVASDARLARTAVGDANQTLAELQARNASFEDATVREEIQHARRAIDQAEHVREHAPVPVAAIAHYRRAWNHAQHALDLMDAETKPNVTITRRADPIRNGTVNYTVRGRVFDVRPHRIGNLTVTVDGQTRPTRNFANATPATPGAFALRVEVDEPTAEITVTATDPGEAISNRSTSWGPQRGRATLALDRDGLSDVVERELTGTNPLAADSNASSTAADESDDGVVDGREDFDGDLLPSRDEVRRGTHPVVADTDGDGLRDGFEAFVTNTDPLAVDSDGDGTADDDEDPDDDGLANAGEQRAGTDPSVADTDGDGVEDANELTNGTDPTRADTDGDGLADGAEPHPPFETDPLDEDTDGDGVLDGEKTYTTTTGNASVGASVSVTDEGNAAAALSIRDGNRSRFGIEMIQTSRASRFVEIETEHSVENARVTVEYDPSRVSNESDLRLYRFNESVGTFLPIESTVHSGNDTVTARPDHFSTVVALSRSRRRANFRESFPSPFGFDDDLADLDGWQTVGNVTTVDGVLVVQHAPENESDGGGGGSGGGGGGGGGGDDDDGDGDAPPDCSVSNPSANCDNDTLTNGEEAAIGTDPTLTDTDGGGTPDGAEVVAGTDPLDPTDDQFTVTIVGGPTVENGSKAVRTIPYPNEVAGVTVEARVRARASGEDSEARVMAQHSGGRRTLLSVASGETGWQNRSVDLTDVSGTLTVEAVAEGDAKVRVDFVRVKNDTDLDGLSDPRERMSCINTTRGCVETEVDDPDTDGDGLEDGRELGEVDERLAAGELVIYKPLSLPDTPHSDSDAINDSVEVRGWDINVTTTSSGEPLRWNGQNDSTTIRATSDPLALHSDDDEIPDGVEKRRLHTRPNESVTYEVTRIHQQQVVAVLRDRFESGVQGAAESFRAIGLVGADERVDAERIDTIDLDDGSDDFDFVLDDAGDIGFRALDGTHRSDTWLSNRRELAEGTEPWDPDTDGDGLTDGQEVKGITDQQVAALDQFSMPVYERDSSVSFETDPLDVDTDGDGYWDGWVGVYDASDSRNVVLYIEHLHDDDDNNGTSTDDGLNASEALPVQAGVHPASATPSAVNGDVTTSPGDEHSNIHVGELQWGTDPRDGTVVPDTSFVLEVDFYAGANHRQLDRESWERGIEENFGLYGIDVDIVRDDTIDTFIPCFSALNPPACVDPSDGFGAAELAGIGLRHSDVPSDEFLFVADAPQGGPVLGSGTLGFNLPGRTQALFTDVISGVARNQVPAGAVDRSPYRTNPSLVSAGVQMHEIGHSFRAGAADDRVRLLEPHSYFKSGEIYSGSQNDHTVERIRPPGGANEWSLMRRSWGAELIVPPMNTRYYAFSIEEVSTLG